MNKILLVRVGADQSKGGGHWNGPVNPTTGEFAYVAIPESRNVLKGHERPYSSPELLGALQSFEITPPPHLRDRHMHLDPDFEHCTYGDQGQRATQLRQLARGDAIIFYAGLRASGHDRLVYALIGQITVAKLQDAKDIGDRDMNAHTRRDPITPDDLVILGDTEKSGRYERCICFGEWRNGAYRVRSDLLDAWGGLTVNDGWLQRSVRLPSFKNPGKFLAWLYLQEPKLVRRNNPVWSVIREKR
jgi:hypothetical protein